MVLARQIEVERCLETKRNRAAILRGLERKQICKVQPCAFWEKERSGVFVIINLFDSFPLGCRTSYILYFEGKGVPSILRAVFK